jgi:hypothetical protein
MLTVTKKFVKKLFSINNIEKTLLGLFLIRFESNQLLIKKKEFLWIFTTEFSKELISWLSLPDNIRFESCGGYSTK